MEADVSEKGNYRQSPYNIEAAEKFLRKQNSRLYRIEVAVDKAADGIDQFLKIFDWVSPLLELTGRTGAELHQE